MSSEIAGSVSWAVRQAEMELRMNDSWPATSPWLLEAASQANTSSLIAPWNSWVMNSTAATVSGS